MRSFHHILLLLVCNECLGFMVVPVNILQKSHGVVNIQRKWMVKGTDEVGEKKKDRPRGFGAPKPKVKKMKEMTMEEFVADDKLEQRIQSSDRFTRMREARERELDSKIARLQEQDNLVAEDPSVGAVPQKVADRMITRIAFGAGLPVFGGLAIFVGAFLYSKKYDVVVPPNLLAYATQLPFILGLMGITYGILSSSWEEEEGSALGFAEFKTNFGRIQDGLKNTRETEALRQEVEDEKRKLGRK